MSYTPTNWQTGDTITAEKLNNMESGIADAPHAPSETYRKNGAPVRLIVYDDGTTTWSLGFEYFSFNIAFDGTDFSVSFTQEEKDKLRTALENSVTVIGFASGFSFGFVFHPATYGLGGFYDLVSGIFPLDDLGLSGYVGYLLMHIDSEGLWNISLVKWQAS